MSTGWLDALERAQRQVTLAVAALEQDFAPDDELTEAGHAIADTLAAIFDAMDERREPLDAAMQARGLLEQAKQGLVTGGNHPPLHQSFAALDGARPHLDRAIEQLGQAAPSPVKTASGPLRASHDRPQLHDVARASLRLDVSLPAPAPRLPPAPQPPPRPTSFDELDRTLAALEAEAEMREARQRAELTPAEPDRGPDTRDQGLLEGFDRNLPPQVMAAELLVGRTRELVEEVAMIGLQRAPLLGDPWRGALPLEQRMFRAIDAVAALGPTAIGAVERLAMDAPVKDGMHLFGATMTLGCLAGRDALAAAERLFFAFERVDPEVRPAFAQAMMLSPHPHLTSALRGWLASSDPRHRAVAVEVLAHRSFITDDDLSAACCDEAAVATEALVPAAARRIPVALERAAAVLLSPDPDDERLLDAARRAAMIAGSRAVGDHLRAATDPRGALYLALWGEQFDAAALLERTQASGAMDDIYALGFTGFVPAVPTLLEALESGDEQVALTAAFALERFTGAELYTELEMEAEDIDVEVPPDPDLGEPPARRLAHQVSDPRDLPPPPATETLWLPTTDPDRWRAWWTEHASDMTAQRRWRRGRPFAPRVVLRELDEARCPPGERHHLQLELTLRSGRHVPLDPRDFVRDQESSLRSWAAAVPSGASAQDGTWHRPDPV